MSRYAQSLDKVVAFFVPGGSLQVDPANQHDPLSEIVGCFRRWRSSLFNLKGLANHQQSPNWYLVHACWMRCCNWCLAHACLVRCCQVTLPIGQVLCSVGFVFCIVVGTDGTRNFWLKLIQVFKFSQETNCSSYTDLDFILQNSHVQLALI